jgi:hypothetical protein
MEFSLTDNLFYNNYKGPINPGSADESVHFNNLRDNFAH